MLFLIVGVVYERRHTRDIAEYGGLLRVMPLFTIVFGIAALSSMGMPPLNSMVSLAKSPSSSAPTRIVELGLLVRRGHRFRRRLPPLAFPAHHAR
jgi:formate hydrogenlyase subunit 3/multisubunit Na+/H+ antiporter MnhD subunit